MVQLTRVWPGGMSLALVSLSVLGCSDESEATRSVQLAKLALEATDDAGTPPDDGGGEVDAAISCAERDMSCDAIDDDCDGVIDEDFTWGCIFGGVAVRCVEGRVIAELCNDSDACTTDSCSAGVCRHTPVTCDDNNPCTADSCTAGSCQSTPVSGAACDDGDACTTGDSCTDSGSCGGGTLVDVDDGNPCTADSCDPDHGVVHTPAAGASCDDANLCTEGDVCLADGSCAGALRADIADSDPCTIDSCDPATGDVTHVVAPLGSTCSDGDACNGAETCELTPQRDFTVEAISTYSRVDSVDEARPAQIVRLSDASLAAGQRIRFRVEGQYTAPAMTRAFVVFSSDSTLLSKEHQHRIPGALQSDAPQFVSGRTWIEQQPTDIPEDFEAVASWREVTIPAGAEYMFLGMLDSYYGDNTGTVTLYVDSLSPACLGGSEPPVIDDGNECTADACDPSAGVTHSPVEDGTECTAEGEAGACVEGACLACSSNPEACQ